MPILIIILALLSMVCFSLSFPLGAIGGALELVVIFLIYRLCKKSNAQTNHPNS